MDGETRMRVERSREKIRLCKKEELKAVHADFLQCMHEQRLFLFRLITVFLNIGFNNVRDKYIVLFS